MPFPTGDSSGYGPPGMRTTFTRPPVCPSWMPRDEFDGVKHDSELIYEACHKRIQEYQQTLETTRKLNDKELHNPQYQYAHAVQQFEELRKEHLSLNDQYNDLETINETVQEVVEVLRADKHQLLVELNSLKREISIQSIENTQLALKEKEALAFQQGLDRKLESQEEQLRQLDGELREYSNAHVQVRNEINALESAAHNLSLQSASLSELRTHLDTTRLQQEQAIRAMESEIEQKQGEIGTYDEQLWDFKREMSARILALQRKVQQSNDELARLHRLSEHEMNTLSQQNRALNEELKNKTDQLFGTRKEMAEFATAARREINIKREEIQQCLSIVDLVERQNQGLEASIARMLEQNRVSETQIQEKDNVNNKNLIEQANFIAMVHMELQTVREDLYMIKSRLCHHCRERLLADEQAEDAKEQQLQELERLRQGPEAYAKTLQDQPAHAAPPPDAAAAGAPAAAPAIAAPNAEAVAEAEKDRQRMKDELKKAHEALEALTRQLVEERSQRVKERQEEEELHMLEEEDRLTRAYDEEMKKRRAEEDERRKGTGEDAKQFTVRFPNGMRKKVEAFMQDTVQELIDRVCDKCGLRRSQLYYIAHAVNENSVLGMVDRFLDKAKTLYDEGITPKCNLNFKFKHYKRPRRWTDLAAQERFFEQLQRNVVSEAYPMTEKLAVHLAGYELQTVFGDPTGKKRHSYFDKVGLDAYLPVSVTPLDYSYWQERLFRSHKKRKNLPPGEARKRYIDTLHNRCSHWGMTFFDIRDKENRPFVAGIAEDGLHILSADRRVFLQRIPFQGESNVLAGWEKSSTGLFVKRRDSNKMTLYASSKLQSEEMFNLLNEYYLLLPKEIQANLDIAINNREVIEEGLPPPEDFEEPQWFRKPPVEFESQVEYLKQLYLEHVFSPQSEEEGRPGPCLKFVEQLDKALDDDVDVTELDLSACDPDLLSDEDLLLITDLFQRAIEYTPDDDPTPVAADWQTNFKANINLKKVNIAANKLTEKAIPEILKMMKDFKDSITDVNLSNLPLDNRYDEVLVKHFQDMKIQHLTLRECRVADRGLRAILNLFQNRTLQTLDLNNNKITHYSMADLCFQLNQAYCSLQTLRVGTNKIQLKGLETLIKVMERARRPLTLDFSDNPLQARGGQRFGQLIEQQSGLTHLDIAGGQQMGITGDVGLYITRQLLNNPEIKHINFSDNPIGTNLQQIQGPGSTARDLPLEFFTFLERTAVCNLEKLIMNRCGLNHDHGAALTSALVDNYKLKELEVSGNRLALGDGGLPQGWMDMLEMGQTLEKLDISRNGLSGRGVSMLCNALGKNRSLKWVCMDGNRFSADADGDRWDEVMYMFATNKSLTEVQMCDMGIGDDLIDSIAEGLCENRTLKTLIASGNLLSAQGVVRLTKHLISNVTLETLDLSCDSVQADEEEYMRTYKILIDNSNLDTVHL